MKIKLILGMALVLFSYCAKSGGDDAGSGSGGGSSAAETIIWAKTTVTGPSASVFNGVAVDSAGNTIACGTQGSGGSYGYGSGVSATGSGGLVIKYNSSGTPVWARAHGTAYFGCVTDSANNVYAVGALQSVSAVTFDTGVTALAAYTTGNSAIIVKYNSSGVAQWAKTTTAGAAASVFNGVAIDSSGNLYAVGYQTGTGSYSYAAGVSATGAATGTNVVIVKYDSAGTAQWAKTTTTGTSAGEFRAVNVDGSGNIFVVGYQTGTGSYQYNAGVTATGTSTTTNAVLVKYDNTGAASFAQAITAGASNSQFNGVGTDSAGSVYAVGLQRGTGTFAYGAGATITAVGSAAANDNAVIVKYNGSGAAQWARTVSGTTYQTVFYSVAVDTSSNVFAVGKQSGTDQSVTYGSGVSAKTSTWCCDNIALVKYDSSGNAQFARTVVSSDRGTSFASVAVDSGGVYAAGLKNQDTSISFSSGTSLSGGATGLNNVLLIKYNK